MIEEQKSFSSGEKNIVSTSDEKYKKAHFLIGCYVYKDLKSLQKGLKDYEKHNYNDVESHHSHILSSLSNSVEVRNIKSNWGIGLGTPEQLDEMNKSLISFNGNREPSTFIVDIDGVIFQHDNGKFSETGDFSENPYPIKENVDKLNELYENGSIILLCSSRPKELATKTKNDLKRIGLKYSDIFLGATSGQRFLINDRKPSNESIDTAISINSTRNQPFQKRIKDLIDFSKDCSKGSGANTTILFDKTNEKKVVRKWVNSQNNNVRETLYKQFSYLKMISQYIDSSVPRILDWRFGSEGISFYDMTHIENIPFSYNSFLNETKKINTLLKVISKLYENSIYSKNQENLNDLSKEIIKKKIFLTTNNLKKGLSKLFKIYEETLPFELITKLNCLVEKLINNNNIWESHNICLIHGDLTLENVLCDKKNNIFLIDPLGSTMDVGKWSNGSIYLSYF